MYVREAGKDGWDVEAGSSGAGATNFWNGAGWSGADVSVSDESAGKASISV